jgi:hypothetical protein
MHAKRREAEGRKRGVPINKTLTSGAPVNFSHNLMEPNSEFSKKLYDPPSAPFPEFQLLCIYGLNVMDGQSKTKRTCKDQ